MDERRWGFAGLDDVEYEQFARSPAVGPRDLVAVSLDPVRVDLADDWRARIDPQRLGGEVVAACARAVFAAPVFEPPATSTSTPDLAPWGGSFARLVEDASRDVARFSAAASQLSGRVVTCASRHVEGSARHGMVIDVKVDVPWARGAPVRDVEAELTDVLARLRRDAVPEGMRQGPSAPATVALQQLSADPALVARLAGMAP